MDKLFYFKIFSFK